MASFDVAMIYDATIPNRIYLIYHPYRMPCVPLDHSDIYMVDVSHFQAAVALMRIVRPEDYNPYNIQQALARLFDVDIQTADSALRAATNYLADTDKYSLKYIGINL